jgi:hypothetical protein
MNRTVFTTIIILLSAITFSFNAKENSEEVVITVRADKKITFDMTQDGETVKGLTTPYNVRIKSGDSRFIFKSKNPTANLRIEAKKKGAKISAISSTIILFINPKNFKIIGVGWME